MKKIIIPLTLFSAFHSSAQEAEPADRKIIFKLETAFVTEKSFQLSDETWNKSLGDFAPDSLSTYNYNNYGSILKNTASVNTISLDFTYRNKFLDSKNIQASFGFILGYGGGSYMQDSYQRRTSTPYDTLVSQQTGTQYPFERTNYETYYRRYTSKDILIGIGNHYSTNTNKIVSFSTGIELVYALSVSSKMFGSYISDQVIEQEGTSNQYSPYYYQYYNSGLHDPNNPNVYYGTLDSKITKGPTMHSFYGRIPLEISFRLGVKDNYWGKSRIGASITPSITYSVMDKNSGTQYSNWMGLNYRLTI